MTEAPSDLAAEALGPVGYDEMVSGKKSLRPQWRELMALVWGMPPEMVREKQARAGNLLSAADQFLPELASGEPHDADSAQPAWAMDLLPLIVAQNEWQAVAPGLTQRAKLLNLILADIYGPQLLIKEKLLPPYLVFNNPGFLRPLRFVPREDGPPPLHFYAADLVRMPGGDWRVLADRTQAPGCVGYALRHRSVAARSFPEAFRTATLHRLQPTVDAWQNSLQALAEKFGEDPGIVLLTPGPHNPSYPEHVLLAHELGITLAQGSDLTVREGMVYLRTLNGLARVHVIYRRVDGDYCDPLELRADSALGVAGLIAAARAGHVAVLNLPGSAVLETPAFASFLPAIARRLLGEELALPAVTTWWCGQKEPLAEVLAAPDKFVFQPAFNPDPVSVDLTKITTEAREQFLTALKAAPAEYVAVERVTQSRVPTIAEQGIEARPVVWRAAAISSQGEWLAMPGGVARVAEGQGQRQALRLGGVVKDVWVLKDEPVPEAARDNTLVEIRKVHRVVDAVGSRTADDLFWLGRYIERFDAGVRLLRAVVARLVRGTPGPRDLAELSLLGQILHENGWMSEADARAPAESFVFARGVAMATGPEGILAGYQLRLRQLGIALRDRLSQDMWRILGAMTKPLHPSPSAGDFDAVLGALDAAVLSVATFSGLVAENMTRGMGWRFLEIGRRIERGIFICGLIEKLFANRPARVELSVRVLLELCDSIITHRKRFPMDPYSLAAVDVVVADAANPRGLLYQFVTLRGELDGLIGHDPLSAEKQLMDRQMEILKAPVLFADLSADRLEAIIGGVKGCSAALIELSDLLSRNFFSHAKVMPTVFFGMNARKEAS